MTDAGAAPFLALVPPFGPRAYGMSSTGVLKLARGAELTVQRSALVFLDAGDGEIGRLEGAFGLPPGTTIRGPASLRLRDERARPEGAAAMRWVLDQGTSPAVPLGSPEEEWSRLRACYFPVQVPLREDFHILVRCVNTTTDRVNLVRAVRTAVLWVDGRAHASTTGWHWDGVGSVDPGCVGAHWFRLSDFADPPRTGEHTCAIEMFGMRTGDERVDWSGDAWTGDQRRSPT